jgi:hypothetical protein
LVFGKQLFLAGLGFALPAMFAMVAGANTLTRAVASADCKGYNLTVYAIDLSTGTNYTIDYGFTVTLDGVSMPISGTIIFTATADTAAEAGSGSWNLTANSTTVTGSATLTISGSVVPIIINGSTAGNGSAVFNCAPGSWSQQGPKLIGKDAVNRPTFVVEQGYSVSLSADGNTAIVGGFGDDNGVGAAWVFTRLGRVWRRQGPKLVGSGALGLAGQGHSVSLSADGNTAIVGGPLDDMSIGGIGAGAAWVFSRAAGVWTQQAKLVGAGAINLPEQGWSVSLSGDASTAIVGGPNDNNKGAAWIFTRSGGVWRQQGPKLVGTGAVGPAEEGASVSLSGDGNTALVGGPADNLLSSGSVGAAWVFTRSGGVWSQQGPKLFGTGAAGDAFQGASVALSADGNTAVLGGPSDDRVGAAWVFTRSGRIWTQQGPKLVGSGAVGVAGQGHSVSLSGDGNTAAVGGFGDSNGLGAAWVFSRLGGVWSQQAPKLVGIGAVTPPIGVGQGWSVSLSGDGSTAIIGGPGDDNRGAAWVFVAAAAKFSGTSGEANCYSTRIAALVRHFRGLNVAAAALGYADIPDLQRAVLAVCPE